MKKIIRNKLGRFVKGTAPCAYIRDITLLIIKNIV